MRSSRLPQQTQLSSRAIVLSHAILSASILIAPISFMINLVFSGILGRILLMKVVFQAPKNPVTRVILFLGFKLFIFEYFYLRFKYKFKYK